jgi:hypothetical protein
VEALSGKAREYLVFWMPVLTARSLVARVHPLLATAVLVWMRHRAAVPLVVVRTPHNFFLVASLQHRLVENISLDKFRRTQVIAFYILFRVLTA